MLNFQLIFVLKKNNEKYEQKIAKKIAKKTR